MNKMNNQERKSKRGNYLWIIILLALPLGYLLKETLELRELKERAQILEKEKERLSQEIQILEQNREKLKQADPFTIEKQAREHLKFSKPGEIIYVPTTTK